MDKEKRLWDNNGRKETKNGPKWILTCKYKIPNAEKKSSDLHLGVSIVFQHIAVHCLGNLCDSLDLLCRIPMYQVQAEFSEELQPKQPGHFQENSWAKTRTFYLENTGHWNSSQCKCFSLPNFWVLELGICMGLFRDILSRGSGKLSEIKTSSWPPFCKPFHLKCGKREHVAGLLNQGTELRLLSQLVGSSPNSTHCHHATVLGYMLGYMLGMSARWTVANVHWGLLSDEVWREIYFKEVRETFKLLSESTQFSWETFTSTHQAFEALVWNSPCSTAPLLPFKQAGSHFSTKQN